MISASRWFEIRSAVKVEYASWRTLQVGKVETMVDMHSSMGMELAIMVERIFDVSVERIHAFTPLPRPSASTTIVESFSPVVVSI